MLLVDDSAFFRNMLAPVLKAAGYRVRVAPNAQEGLLALRSGQNFDVVLTDIEMPDMNGFEFAETIRADQHLNQMPIIALSSMVSPAAIERGRQAGFHDYVAKFDRPGLIAALKEQTAETSESLDTVDNQLVRFEQDPSDAKILDNIFRLVHTIKGTCGFLGLPRLEALAHAGETLMGKFRDGMPVKAEAVTLILSSIDRIKEILAGLEATETEPEGTDEDLIEKLHAMAEGGHHAEAEPAPAPSPWSPHRRCSPR